MGPFTYEIKYHPVLARMMLCCESQRNRVTTLGDGFLVCIQYSIVAVAVTIRAITGGMSHNPNREERTFRIGPSGRVAPR
jgi:hypothetical protein